jgi:myo-inositol-1(or 4)-monophosphatase
VSSHAPDRAIFESLRRVAVEAARAGARALDPFVRDRAELEVEAKAANDFVTRADLASERAISAVIRGRYPDHGLLGEEEAYERLGGPDPLWIIDPLDGTTNFIRGFPIYAVSVACSIESRVVAGAVLDVARDEMFSASRGGGTFAGDRPLRVSGRAGLAGALIATGFPFRRRPRMEAFLGAFRAVFAEVSDIRRAGAAAIDLASVAAGRLDGFWEEGLGPWDIAAGSLLVEEAGGVVTDFAGGADFLAGGAVVAAGPGVHGPLRDLVHRHQGTGEA